MLPVFRNVDAEAKVPGVPGDRPRLWIVGRGELSSRRRLGPAVRLLAMARMAKSVGLEPVVVLDTVEEGLEEGLSVRPLGAFRWSEVSPRDRVVVSAHLPWRLLVPLLRSSLAFDVDSHGIGAVEGMESPGGLAAWRLFQGRRRTALRLRILLHRCDKIYLSTPEQTAFLGGMLFRESSRRDVALASDLPKKVLYAPMGLNAGTFLQVPAGSPWPPAVGQRPVFLWGGGIWSWFDIPTLLEAFAILRARGSEAVLYFLAGTNPSGLASQDEPVEAARRKARELGLLGENVFFHDGMASPAQLPLFLQSSRCGILANPLKLESVVSWRTRLLDLLWVGRPAVVCGSDPLACRMAQAGAAIIAPAGDADALAQAVSRMCDDASAWKASCEAALSLAPELDWHQTLSEVVEWWQLWPKVAPPSPTCWSAILRCVMGA